MSFYSCLYVFLYDVYCGQMAEQQTDRLVTAGNAEKVKYWFLKQINHHSCARTGTGNG
ncbi:hypothetical protein B0I21_11081 [Sphingobacterium paludis]|uniref:Uncharacterized protein n=1 Tax=Sphingobacterium paludis TaxID=1476465 RepID=A0A4R7CSJ0_9SPHI|nr:hypothetical protein B0I21_11081 [Sphingobacterium paludis]